MSRRKRIFFDQTQNERGRIDSTYSQLAQLLRDNDYDVEPYTEFMILKNKLESVDLLVFGCPNSSKLRPAEIDVLKSFVENGGGLMLLALSGGDRGLMNNLSQLSQHFGITFENTAVKDDRKNAGLPTMPIISDFSDHPIVDGVKELLLPSACTLKVSSKEQVVALTSGTADPSSQPIIAASECGKGRVICIGSYEVFRRGGGMKNEGNKMFAVNAFGWLTGRNQSPDVETESKKKDKTKKSETKETEITGEMEQTLRRLVNAVFDLQKDIQKVDQRVGKIETGIERLREQFQDFANKTQDQLGIMIPAKQFKTEEENKKAEIEEDIRALEKEIESVRQLRDHVEQKHTSGSMSTETYEEQVAKLEERIKRLDKRIEKRQKDIEKLEKD